jgi:mono/diheme cytochrome c family protein
MNAYHAARIAILATALLLATAALTACEGDTDGAATTTQAASADFDLGGNAEAGADVYATQCASCHGATGGGDGAAGRALTPEPTDFTTGDLDAQRAYNVVKKGGMAEGMAPTMPGFERTMDDQTIRDVVAYIMAFGN